MKAGECSYKGKQIPGYTPLEHGICVATGNGRDLRKTNEWDNFIKSSEGETLRKKSGLESEQYNPGYTEQECTNACSKYMAWRSANDHNEFGCGQLMMEDSGARRALSPEYKAIKENSGVLDKPVYV